MSQIRALTTDILIVGSGAAGMSAAVAASASGASVIVADDRKVPGGVLTQCVHSGFGLGRYGKEMTGPEYSKEEFRRFDESSAIYLSDCRVLSLSSDKTALVSGSEGLSRISFRECILATGCTERPLWSLPVSGTRPEGVYTAGEAQEMIELGGYDTGNNVFILGSGDIGQIMARRFIQLGKTVVGMAEQKDHLGGMKRNQEECIRAYDIPVTLNSTVTEIHGSPHLTGVTLHHLDSGTDELIECDTLITALGLEPDRSLAEGLENDNGYPGWLHFCGNADFVHDIADSASTQGEKLGRNLACRIQSNGKEV
ncbi:MAG: FAD-dependent oxidoreductase [Mogibacterium sp.]|nr:FAD-dependent oxidoreductase [Mogibacterium sp.]MBQ6501097.1 FAD-dependent oxidoreductase [Mogibacterium sp.]